MFDPLKDYYNPLEMTNVRIKTKEIARIIIFSKMKSFNYSTIIETTAVKWLKAMLDFLLDTRNEKYSIKDMTTLYQVVDDFFKGNIEEEFLISKDEREFYQEQEKTEGGNFKASVFALISLSLTEFRDRLVKKENTENHFSLKNSFITKDFFEKRKTFYFMIEKENIQKNNSPYSSKKGYSNISKNGIEEQQSFALVYFIYIRQTITTFPVLLD